MNSEEKEVYDIVQFMFEAGTKLKIDSLSLTTAVTLFHRFYDQYKYENFDLKTIATTFIYLGCKIEEESVKLRDVINVCHRIINPNQKPLELDESYWIIRNSIIKTELYLVRALQFQVNVNHPHKYLMHYLKSIYDWLDSEVTEKIPIARICWALLMDSYHSNQICLKFEPSFIAVSIIYLALKIYGVQIPGSSEEDENNGEENGENCAWWKALVDDVNLNEIKTIALKLMKVYDLEKIK